MLLTFFISEYYIHSYNGRNPAIITHQFPHSHIFTPACRQAGFHNKLGIYTFPFYPIIKPNFPFLFKQ